jgi:hypothetical protein
VPFLQLSLATALAASQTPSSKNSIIPDARWTRSYFNSIDDFVGLFNFKPLRSMELSSDDLELRIWSISGRGGLNGKVIKRVDSTWSAISLNDSQSPIRKLDAKSKSMEHIEPSLTKGPTTTDWCTTWNILEQAGIRHILDDSEIQHTVEVFDGTSYVVEIAKHNYYRTYMVDNPDVRAYVADNRQTKQSENYSRFLSILSVIKTAFGEETPK